MKIDKDKIQIVLLVASAAILVDNRLLARANKKQAAAIDLVNEVVPRIDAFMVDFAFEEIVENFKE